MERPSLILREATAEAHARVDALVRPHLDRGVEGCRVFLGVAQSIVVPWERELVRFAWPARLRIDERLRKTEWLAEDLGGMVASERIARAGNQAEAWGALYVFEGSTLGSTMIARMFHGTTFRYLRGYGTETQAMWSSMKAALDDALQSEQERNDAARAARGVFAQFEEALA
jgi:heme oxygenase